MKKLVVSLLTSALLSLTCFMVHADEKDKEQQKQLITELRMIVMRETNTPREHPDVLESSSSSPAKHQMEEFAKKKLELWKKIHELQKKIDPKAYPPQVFEESQFLQSLMPPPPAPVK